VGGSIIPAYPYLQTVSGHLKKHYTNDYFVYLSDNILALNILNSRLETKKP